MRVERDYGLFQLPSPPCERSRCFSSPDAEVLGGLAVLQVVLRFPGPLLTRLLTSLPPAGCCAAQEILPEGPVEGIVGRNVTLKTLLDKPVYSFIVWNFNDGTEQNNIATLTKTSLRVSDGYKDRASIDDVTGSLSLVGLKPEDNGDYSITILTEDGTTRTAEIRLQVLGESARSGPLTLSFLQ